MVGPPGVVQTADPLLDHTRAGAPGRSRHTTSPLRLTVASGGWHASTVDVARRHCRTSSRGDAESAMHPAGHSYSPVALTRGAQIATPPSSGGSPPEPHADNAASAPHSMARRVVMRSERRAHDGPPQVFTALGRARSARPDEELRTDLVREVPRTVERAPF